MNSDVFIPVPNEHVSSPSKLYLTAGYVLGICARTGLVQDFLFPDFFWNFLANGLFNITDIYSIDQVYKHHISSLREAQKSGISPEEFSQQFNIRYVVLDSLGKEVPLIPNGSLIKVTLDQIDRYIALSNEFRINEILQNLTQIRNGFWANLGIDPKSVKIDGSTLQFAICGDKDISYEALRDITVFKGIAEDQKEIIFQVFRDFTPMQRSALLKFSTGRIRIPPKSLENMTLNIDNTGSIDECPSSSTCFYALHVPRYTSYEKAFRLISAAIEFADTFENS